MYLSKRKPQQNPVETPRYPIRKMIDPAENLIKIQVKLCQFKLFQKYNNKNITST
jgi:hypothetical protein